jgi:hypothetical protein
MKYYDGEGRARLAERWRRGASMRVAEMDEDELPDVARAHPWTERGVAQAITAHG